MKKESHKAASLADIIGSMQDLLSSITNDLEKSVKGNKAASQRVRTGTVKLEKVAKQYRKESILSEKQTTKTKAKGRKVAAAPAKGKAKAPKAAPAKAAAAKAPAKAPAKAKAAPAPAAKAKVKTQKATVKAKGFAVKRPTAKLPARNTARK